MDLGIIQGVQQKSGPKVSVGVTGGGRPVRQEQLLIYTNFFSIYKSRKLNKQKSEEENKMTQLSTSQRPCSVFHCRWLVPVS